MTNLPSVRQSQQAPRIPDHKQKAHFCDRHHTQLVSAITFSGMNLW